MADGIHAKIDFTGVFAKLDALGGPVKESLGRRMGVEGGVHLRDKAKGRALIADNRKGVARRGLLAGAIYLAYDKDISRVDLVRYVISWNAKIAPHGHLIEFGHWRYNRMNSKGYWMPSLKPGLTKGSGPESHEGPGALKVPQWVAARPFLRPTLDADGTAAIKLAIERGRRELPILLAEFGK